MLSDSTEMNMPADFKEKLRLVQDERMMFGDGYGSDSEQMAAMIMGMGGKINGSGKFKPEMFEGDLSPISKKQIKKSMELKINSRDGSLDLKQINPKLYQKVDLSQNFKVSSHQRSISILDPSVQKLDTLVNSNFQLPDISGFISPDDASSPQRFHQPKSYLPDTIKQYLQKKSRIDKPQQTLQQKLRKQINKTSLDHHQQSLSEVNFLQHHGVQSHFPLKKQLEILNHSSILLKQAKDILQTVSKSSQTTTNLGLLKLQKELREQLINETPSQMTLQRDLLENFNQFKHLARLNKFQVEDLYIKRENAVPLDMMEELEKVENEIQSRINNEDIIQEKQEDHERSTVFVTEKQANIIEGEIKTSSLRKSYGSRQVASKSHTLQLIDPSKIKVQINSAQQSGQKIHEFQMQTPSTSTIHKNPALQTLEIQHSTSLNQRIIFQTHEHQSPSRLEKLLKQHNTNPLPQDGQLQNEMVDLFDLNNNIQKFSYQNMKNEKELRELKLQNQSKYKSLEKMLRREQLKKNIESYKDFKQQREFALRQVREVTKVNNSSQTELKLPQLSNRNQESSSNQNASAPLGYSGKRNKSQRQQSYQFSTLQQKRKQDQANDIEKIAMLSARRISLASKIQNDVNMTIDKWGETQYSPQNIILQQSPNSLTQQQMLNGYLDRVAYNQQISGSGQVQGVLRVNSSLKQAQINSQGNNNTKNRRNTSKLQSVYSSINKHPYNPSPQALLKYNSILPPNNAHNATSTLIMTPNQLDSRMDQINQNRQNSTLENHLQQQKQQLQQQRIGINSGSVDGSQGRGSGRGEIGSAAGDESSSKRNINKVVVDMTAVSEEQRDDQGVNTNMVNRNLNQDLEDDDQ